VITQGYWARHYQNRSGQAAAALLDVVQDYALKLLHDREVFAFGVALKGGTALRKLRAGNAGRFSTDLDFAAPDEDIAQLLLDTLDGAELFAVRFHLTKRQSLRANLEAETPLGPLSIPARVEVSTRPLWLPIQIGSYVHLQVHEGYEFAPPPIPVPALEEALAEKLAAWRRRHKLRDLYDLDFFGRGVVNEPLVRRILLLKVWHDVVDEGLGDRPFDPSEVTQAIDVRQLPPEDIGLLAPLVAPATWLTNVRTRYAFVTRLDAVETQVARCNIADRYLVTQLVEELRLTAG
jgi:predicted nucleotidyltransferase component of viral defense system